MKRTPVYQEIKAVQPNQRDERGELLHRTGQGAGGRARERGRLHRTAIAKRLLRGRRRPLGTEAENHGRVTVREHQCRHGIAAHSALKVVRFGSGSLTGDDPDVCSTRSAASLCEPTGGIVWKIRPGIGMRNSAAST